MKPPPATQLATWMSWNLAAESDATGDPLFLHALRATQAGDRQLIWEGGGGRGIIAVVDFSHEQLHDGSRWRSWGRTTVLPVPVGRAALATVPALESRFFGRGAPSLQGGLLRLPEAEAHAIDRLAGGLPPRRPPQRPPRAGEPLHRWLGSLGIDPEKTFELAIHSSPRLWRRIGFPEAPIMQERLTSPGEPPDVPDLYSPGVIGEVKRIVTAQDGPDQVARYLRRLTRDRPEHAPWRAVLIQGDGRLNPAAQRRLEDLDLPITVWAIINTGVRRWKAVRLWGSAT
jgi:hypothetical protein